MATASIHLPALSNGALSTKNLPRFSQRSISFSPSVSSLKSIHGGVKRTSSITVVRASSATTEAATAYQTEGVKVDEGLGELTRVTLSTPGGSVVEIYLYGGVPTSWKLPSGEDLLYVRPDAVFTGKKPISGGIPHCFPQFGPGAIQQHGFARNSFWTIASSVGGASPAVTLRLVDDEYTRGIWDFAFEALFTVTLADDTLTTVLQVKNTDSKPFDFTAALHTYFRGAISGVKVKGLKGLTFLNKDPDPKNPIPGVEERDEVTFTQYVDSVYLGAPSEIVLDNGLGTNLSIANQNWPDAVVWSPYLTMEACYKEFVCVENAQISPVTVAPGETWTAEQVLTPK